MNITRSNALCLLLASMVAAAASAQGEQRLAGRPRAGEDSGGQDPAATAQGPRTLHEAWLLALSTMRAHKAPGLVFVLPPKDQAADPAAVTAALAALPLKGMGRTPAEVKTARDLLLLRLQLLRAGALRGRHVLPEGEGAHLSDVDLSVAFALAVPVVAEAAACGAESGETLLLLGPDGKRVAGFAVDLGSPAAVAAAIGPHLFEGKALTARQLNVPPALQRAADEFDTMRRDEDPAAQEKLGQRFLELQRQLHAAAPALLQVRDGKVQVRYELRAMLEQTVPLGTAVGEEWDPCPPCGMMAAPLPLRSALKLLAQ